MAFGRRSSEERAAHRQAKEQRKAETRERLMAHVEKRRREEEDKRREAEDKRIEALTAVLQPGEEVEALFKTAEAVMKKYVLLTSARLIVASVHTPNQAESILYRAISSFETSKFITRDIALEIAGRRDRLELQLQNDEERDEVLRVLQSHLV
jgi:hypothetical protein